MLKEKRMRMIMEILQKKEFVKVKELHNTLDVTEMTIWRDLKELEDKGAIRRMRGGAKWIAPINDGNLLHTKRMSLNLDKKKIIAKKAAALIEDKDVIFISSSSTNELIKEYIQAKDVCIVTNSLVIFRQYYMDLNFEVLLIGGKFHHAESSFLGSISNDFIGGMRFKKAFMGTNGIRDNSCFASNDEEGVFYRMVLNNTDERYVLCDTTKFNKDAFYRYYSCDDLSAIITDNGSIEHRELYEGYTKLL